MGLLEKALEYKKEMNRKGHETIMDRIMGPAETDLIVDEDKSSTESVDQGKPVDSIVEVNGKDEIYVLGGDDLVAVEEDNISTEIGDEVPVTDELDNDFILDEEISESPIESDMADHARLEEFAIDERELETQTTPGREIEDELFELPAEEESTGTGVLPGTKGPGIGGGSSAHEDKKERIIAAVESRPFVSDDTETDLLGPEDEPDLSVKKRPVIEEAHGDDNEVERSTVSSGRNIDRDMDESMTDEYESVSEASYDETDMPMNGDSFEAEEDTRFDDYLLLYEIEKEIIKCTTKEELYDVILFTLMGQIGSTSSSIIVPDSPDSPRWILPVSQGVAIDNHGLYFNKNEGILGELHRLKKIMDLDVYKNDPGLQDDYLNYLAIDARYMAPIVFRKNIIGAVLLGDKVSVEDYTDEEKAFIRIVCRASAIVLNNIVEKEKLNREIEFLKNDLSDIRHVDWFQEKIVNENSIDQIRVTVRDEFEKLGILSYAIFVQDRKDGSFFPYFVELEDFLSLQEDDFRINSKAHLIKHLGRSEAPVIVDDFKNAGMIIDVFDENRINKMAIFRAYPFVLGNRLNGIIVVFRMRDDVDVKKIDNKIKKISRFIFSYIEVMRESDSRGKKYIDNIEVIFYRIAEELENAAELNIPVTFALFSIKNFKRYYNLFGYDESRFLLENFEKIIRSRLSDTDFSFRYGRNRFLLVLPGKDKKYTVPLANAIRNKVVESSGGNNIQLLVTFMIAEYPEDGSDLFSIMDSLE